MKDYKIDKELAEIRKKYRDLGIPCTSDVRYQELILIKNRKKKAEKEKEVKLAKIRDLWRVYCEKTTGKPSKEEFLKNIKGLV